MRGRPDGQAAIQDAVSQQHLVLIIKAMMSVKVQWSIGNGMRLMDFQRGNSSAQKYKG